MMDTFDLHKLEQVVEIHKWSEEKKLMQLELLLSGRAE